MCFLPIVVLYFEQAPAGCSVCNPAETQYNVSASTATCWSGEDYAQNDDVFIFVVGRGQNEPRHLGTTYNDQFSLVCDADVLHSVIYD